MIYNTEINDLILKFQQVSTNQERVAFEQQLNILLPKLSLTEKDLFFAQIFETTLNSLQSLGKDLDNNQLSHIERLLALQLLKQAA